MDLENGSTLGLKSQHTHMFSQFQKAPMFSGPTFKKILKFQVSELNQLQDLTTVISLFKLVRISAQYHQIHTFVFVR